MNNKIVWARVTLKEDTTRMPDIPWVIELEGVYPVNYSYERFATAEEANAKLKEYLE